MVETRLPAAIDAIVAALKAAGMPVYDGPVLTADDALQAVFIGYDADPDGDRHAADTTQRWADSVGKRTRYEELIIMCAAVALTGDEPQTWKPIRDIVYALIDTVGQTLRVGVDAPSLGLPPSTVAELMPGPYFQEDTPDGYQARVVFAIRIETRV